MSLLPRRARSVLYALVTEFIATGEPIGSRTLSKKYGFLLSPATIRNVLADLEDSGFLAQPHASAGRIPTATAFRLFIDALMQERELPEGEANRISELAELPPGVDLLRETGKLLSDMSGATAVLVRMRADRRILSKVHFIRTRPLELLAVMVATDGTVDNRFIALDHPIDDPALERLHNMLDEVVVGRTLSALRDHFALAAHDQHGEIVRLVRIGHALLEQIANGFERRADVVVEGQARLLDQPEFGNVEVIRELLSALEDRERLVVLLDQAINAERVNVFMGEDTRRMVGCAVSLVAAGYRDEDGTPGGALGIIGPQRMDYPFVVPLVAATADAMTSALAKKRD
ncbi:MAG: heat-inducible transcriptional repressor HrcA [Polyangiaceae bacterium]